MTKKPRTLYRRLLRGEPFGFTSWTGTDESDFRWSGALVLSVVMFGLLLVAVALSLYEHNYRLLGPLLVSGAVPVAAWAMLYRMPRNPMRPLLLMNATLMVLGSYLLVVGGGSSWSSLFWFLLFPTMVMFSAGLRYGSYMFAIFYGLLLLLMVTPLKSFLAQPLPAVFAMRFLLAMLGAFVFAWCAEYMRYHTRKALMRAVKRLEQDALTDQLTGLGNRRDFQSYFSWVTGKSARENRPFAIAMVDVDHFKRVNDNYGHELGDKVLQHVVSVITSDMRPTDRLFRWGGRGVFAAHAGN